MADLSGASEDLQKFMEAVRKATSNLSDGNDLASEYLDDEKDRNREIKKEFDKLGLILKDHDKVVGKDTESLKERAKNEKLVNEQLIASGKVRANATKEEIEAYKLTQKQNEAFRAQLDAMGKYLDETGKVIDTTVRLSVAQQKQLNQERIYSDKKNKQEQNLSQLQTDLATKFNAANVAVTGLKVGFELLKAGINGTYKGILAMQDALLTGAEDETVRAAAAAAQADELASTYGSLGNSAITVAEGLAALAIPLVVIAPELAALGLAAAAVTGALGWLGIGLQKEAELESKRIKQQAEQAKELFAGYQKLSNASLVGAEGITGLYNDLHRVGLAVSEFEKLNKVLSSNSKEMAMFAGTTISGVKTFTKQAGDLLKSDLGRTLEIMGIGAEEQYQHQMAFMTQQSQFGLKVNGDIKKATYTYITELDKLAVLTGQSRKEQEDDRKAIMSLNQLRAAQIEAEEKNDKARSEELQRAFETASKLRAVDAQAAEGLAKYFAAGGAVDQASARAAQTFGGKGGTIEQIKSGRGSQVDRYSTGIEELYRQEARFAATTRMTGGIEGQTGETGKIVDARKGLVAAKDQAQKTGQTLDKLLDQQKTVTDKATISAVDERRANREKKLATDDEIRSGYEFGDATKIFSKAVDKFAGSKGAQGAPNAVTTTAIRASQQQTTNQVAANYTKTQITPEEARNVLDNGSERDIAAFGGRDALTKIALSKTAPAAAQATTPSAPAASFRVAGAAQAGQGGTTPSAPAASFRVAGAAQAGQGGTTPTVSPSAAGSNWGAYSSAGGSTGFVPTQGGSGRGGQGGRGFEESIISSAAGSNWGAYSSAGGSTGFVPTQGGSGRGGQGGAGFDTGGDGSRVSLAPTIPPTKDTAKQSIGAAGSADMDFIRKNIINHEGMIPYPYKDTLGKWTIGIGHLIGDGSKLPPEFDAWKNNGPAIGAGSKNNNKTPAWTDAQIYEQLDKDIGYVSGRMPKTTPNFDAMTTAGKNAFIDLGFNMGPDFIKVKGFKQLDKSLNSKDNKGIVDSLTNSKWYSQVNKRGREIVGLAGQAFNVSAAEGGIVDGPKSGFPATLHGNEIITPLSPNSILEQLGKTSVEEVKSMGTTDTMKEFHSAQQAVMDILSTKLDDVIDRLDRGNTYSDKLVKAMV